MFWHHLSRPISYHHNIAMRSNGQELHNKWIYPFSHLTYIWSDRSIVMVLKLKITHLSRNGFGFASERIDGGKYKTTLRSNGENTFSDASLATGTDAHGEMTELPQGVAGPGVLKCTTRRWIHWRLQFGVHFDCCQSPFLKWRCDDVLSKKTKKYFLTYGFTHEGARQCVN